MLKELIKEKQLRMAEIDTLIEASNDINEVKTLGKEKRSLQKDVEKLSKVNDQERSFDPIASYGITTTEVRSNEDPLSTMEYRSQFMDYVQKGKVGNLLKRADSEHVSGDLGILLPNTIVNEIIKGVEKVYGQLYSRVKKTNLKGGVQYPLGSFSAEMYWQGTDGTDTEHGVSENQKTGAITGYVQFTYHLGEIRIAQSLLQSVLTVDAFEAEVVKALVEAYVKAMDEAILNGDGVKQPEGILTEANKGESRIPTANIITFTADEMADWKSWQKKLFAKIPLSMRGLRPEFVMTAETWESNIMTLEDSVGRPVYRETYNPVTGDESASFKGRNVVFVEEGGIKSFDTASANDYFAMYWVPEKAYAMNSNMQFSYKKYFDEKTNQYITKGLVIVDGKVLDPKYIYLLKKGA